MVLLSNSLYLTLLKLIGHPPRLKVAETQSLVDSLVQQQQEEVVELEEVVHENKISLANT